MKKVKSGSDISFSFNVKVTDKTTVDEIIREASDIIKVRFAEYKVEPEESEDERIRKEIIDYLHLVGKGDGDYAQPMIDRWITWLEQQECGEKGLNGPQEIGDWRGDEGVCKKQKEQKEETLRDFIDNFPYSDKQKEQEPIVTHGETYHVDTLGTQQMIAGKMPQKPAEKQDYSDLTDLERAIHRGFLSAGVENVPVTIIKETANECKRTQTIANENANAEWSEEDKSFYDSIMCEVVKEGMHPTPEQANWFKSLPERFNSQPKQEWSKEDEMYLSQAIETLEHENYFILADKLKSLRSKPHRKPSKEQEEPEYYQHFDPDC